MDNFWLQHIGLASVELNERLFSVTEFDDDDFCTELEAVVVLLGPKECIVPATDGEVCRHWHKTIENFMNK